MKMNDALNVPDFLRVTPEEVTRRKKYNNEHPPTTTNAFDLQPKEDEKWRESKAILEEAEKVKTKIGRVHREQKKVAAAEAEAATKAGLEWHNGRWIKPGQISRAKYDRLMRDMPTDKHREILREQFADKVIGGVKGKRD